MKRILAALTGLIAFGATAAGAQQNACAPRDQVVAKLAESYGETRRSIGLGSNNNVMEVFASAETGSWTITVTSVTGLTCLIASGQAFEALNEVLQAPESDA
ncbi:hypothetical protein [Salipiger abyssi]|uniref:Uncharacterized protein n=1 Tax=Salipiger abyssi TaxID=1250539 RepID=A0A1P8UVQ9_9RHOB|nr:hypothetical protein [Salipiger abyssi]APZ53475.1 hypothetical protein Ga0080574_TMP3141 [Salipiger abyssi]MBN9889157.1 hypothetical protein [Salipiger abyssi]